MFQNKTIKFGSTLTIVVIWFLSLGWFLNSYIQSQATDQNLKTFEISDISIAENQNPVEIYNFGNQEYPNTEFLNNSVYIEVLKGAEQAKLNPELSAPAEAPNPTNPETPNQVSNKPSIPISDKTGVSNTLDFPNLRIQSPLIYASLADIFQKNSDGSININSPILEDLRKGPLSTPVQRLLTKGIVHLPFSPNPGELGNSYIVGHSSNYASVKSDYNYIFKDLNKAKIGDEFTIYNNSGQGMVFKVFESVVVSYDDVEQAYQDFETRRVVTLQASVLVNGKPLRRLLVRGELAN